MGLEPLSSTVLAVQVRTFYPQPAGPPRGGPLLTQYYAIADGRYLGAELGVPRLIAVSNGVAFTLRSDDSLTIVGHPYRLHGGTP